jgi:DNA-binding NarL/FixJ family response regulator
MTSDGRASSLPATRIVLVDDNAAALHQVIELLPAGFDVCATLPDGHRLLQVIDEQRPAIVVLDITLPDANGITLASDLARHSNRPKIVMLTIHADSDYVKAAFAAGADAYVAKIRLHSDLVPALWAVLAGESFVSQVPGLEEARAEPRRLR